jgi:hypothetical protein
VEIIAPNFCQKNGGKRIPLAAMRSPYQIFSSYVTQVEGISSTHKREGSKKGTRINQTVST